MKKIQLGGHLKYGKALIRGYALVDNEDYEWLNQWHWSYKEGYALRLEQKDNKVKRIWMHRVVNKTPVGMETDHINRNPLDNRKSNLRSVNHKQNNMNKGMIKSNTSGRTGVAWSLSKKLWRAYITVDQRQLFLGYFRDFKKAVSARMQAEALYQAIPHD